jgi:hypothetical protein
VIVQSMMPRDQAARQGFPGDRDDIVDAWLESAMVSLQCGRVSSFLHPSDREWG